MLSFKTRMPSLLYRNYCIPTKAWTKSGEEDVYSLNIKNSIAALDEQELNTPNVDTKSSNEFIAHAWDVSCKEAQK